LIRKSKKESVLAFVNEAAEPVDVEKIRIHCGIGNWNTALNYCLELLLGEKIKGQKTSKSWVFWTHEETKLEPWDEAIGSFEKLEIDEEKVTTTLSTHKNIRITYPKNTAEAQTLTQTLTNTKKGTKIAILKTDNPQKPIIIRTLNEPTITPRSNYQKRWFCIRGFFIMCNAVFV
jgi:hypothetical protein